MGLPWFYIHPEEIPDSPALVVFTDRVEANIAEAIRMTGDVNRLRPHIKTCKSSGAVKRLLAAGITKFKCATIAEAELLGRLDAPDVLLAYQLTGPKIQRFIDLITRYSSTRFSCLIDNIETARELSEAFAEKDLTATVFIDLNIGMNRTGIAPDEKAIDLYKWLSSAAAITLLGLHAYDGHIRAVNMDERIALCNEAFDKVLWMKERLATANLHVSTIIVGGSPTFPIHASRVDVECSPGTFIYWDKGYSDGCPEQNFQPAAVLITRVISVSGGNAFTTDLGHKSVAAENEISKRVFIIGDESLNIVGQSEEHLVVNATLPHHHKVGDVLYGIPFHICPTVALYEQVYTSSNGKITGEWRNEARDRKLEDGI